VKTPGLVAGGIAATMSLATAPTATAQERSLDEIKTEVMRRAGRINPFEGIAATMRSRWSMRSPASIAITGPRRGARSVWLTRGRRTRAPRQGASGQELAELYTLAFEYCHIARYPVASTPGKKEAYRHSLRLFRKAAKHYEPPLAIVEIPFEARRSSAICRFPQGIAKPPVVMHWGGVDGWKENRQRASGFSIAPASPP
jgi:hypothetical protein